MAIPQYADLQETGGAAGNRGPHHHLNGANDGVAPATDGNASAAKFTGRRIHRVVPRAGHNLPQEEPEAFAAAVMELIKAAAMSDQIDRRRRLFLGAALSGVAARELARTGKVLAQAAPSPSPARAVSSTRLEPPAPCRCRGSQRRLL